VIQLISIGMTLHGEESTLTSEKGVSGRRNVKFFLYYNYKVRKSKLIINYYYEVVSHATGSRLWNSLPSDVVDCRTVDTFRRRLKHFFFNVSFS